MTEPRAGYPLGGGGGQGAEEALAAAFIDVPTLLSLRAAFAALDPAGEPEARVLAPPAPQSWGEQSVPSRGGFERNLIARTGSEFATSSPPQHWGAGGAGAIGILAGSFDPLTNAHVALARAARDAGGCDVVFLALSRHTVNKEARVRPSDADRALLLALFARREPRLGVLAFNRGLYADQAVAARATFPDAGDIRFVVGFDKARQIFDPRYYADRDAALRALFGRVALLAAPRADDGPDDLAALLGRPENRPFRDRVRALPFDHAWAADSATAVRAAARDGRPYAALVPPETVAFIEALAPYAAPPADGTPDRYDRREAILARLAADPTGEVAGAEAELRALLAG